MGKELEDNKRVFHREQVLVLSDIQNRIFTIRGVQVMLDRDLANQYQVATKALNQAVKRNIRRFPERFMFQLTKEEFDSWKSQIVTSNVYSPEEIDALKMGARRCPYAFTEQGVSQLSAVLHSDDKKLDVVLDKLEELSPAVTTEQLFPSGCVWDAKFMPEVVMKMVNE